MSNLDVEGFYKNTSQFVNDLATVLKGLEDKMTPEQKKQYSEKMQEAAKDMGKATEMLTKIKSQL